MKINKKIISLLLSGIIIYQSNLPLALAFSNNIENKTYKSINLEFDETLYIKDISDKLNETLDLLNEYFSSKDLVKLKEAIAVFNTISGVITYKEVDIFEDGDIFDSIFYLVRDEIYSIDDNETKVSMIIYFGEQLFLGWRKYKDIPVYGEKYLISGLVEYNKNKVDKAQSRLNYLKSLHDYFLDKPDYEFDSDFIPEIDIDSMTPDFNPPAIDSPTLDVPDDGIILGDTNDTNNDIKNPESPSLTTGSFTEYIRVGDDCKKVITTYENGITTSKKEYFVPKDEYVKCKIYKYVHNGKTSNNKVPIVDRDYLDNNQNEDSKNSIHYTVKKNIKNPYYFDTGIKTSAKNDSVSYNQLKDALYQLAIKAEGFNINDNDKTLTILEGKPIVISNSKETYSKYEVENLLNAFSECELKIMESTSQKYNTLDSIILSGKLNAISVNNEVKELSTPALLIDNQLFMPINDIASSLGASINYDGKNVVINNDSTNIKFTVGSKNYTINKESYIFTSEPIIKDYTYFCEIEKISEALGYEVLWDSDTGLLSFNNK